MKGLSFLFLVSAVLSAGAFSVPSLSRFFIIEKKSRLVRNKSILLLLTKSDRRFLKECQAD